MERRTLFAAGALAAVMPVARLAYAQAAPDAEKQNILLGGNFALLTSRMAVDKATDPAVKAFAGLEVSEQEAVARAFGAAPSDQVTTEHAAMMEQLAAMSGAEFDRMYLQGQMTGHEQLRSLHSAYAENGSDPMAKGASIVAVPAIDSHMSMLRAIQQRLG
ncbi:DUF4142 domain-containing protein [Paracoccus benzoatiresistens]|uniref:DUF4142 domain-containing protein n=1 Tax=Paracoccus benzoatiresistens TaxID=2997341 RepID=A0ABT4J1N7_9RHOB|nr:DUF4142 domain-containing protein [Paracoccus sp. EF6]MCZ0961027.1 DUF4142 domain-containing protein [Paracoccus sp. EF6]